MQLLRTGRRHGRVWSSPDGPPQSTTLGAMKLVGLIIVSVLAYAVVGVLMQYVLAVDPESQWYWLPFVFSALVLGVGLFVGFRRAPRSPLLVVATTLSSLVLVLAVDIAIAVVHSCARGVCI